MKRITAYTLIFIFFLSCNERVPVPKPRMYPRVDFPTRTMDSFDQNFCDLTFEFPDYAIAVQDSLFFDETPADPCWFDLEVRSLNAELHCSYYPITSTSSFDSLVMDAFNLAGKHNIKANYRRESIIENPSKNIFGLLFEIEGPVATPLQFFLTDSTSHFFRASLYFNDKVDPDSTQVVLDFLKQDINHMIETFEWKPSQ